LFYFFLCFDFLTPFKKEEVVCFTNWSLTLFGDSFLVFDLSNSKEELLYWKMIHFDFCVDRVGYTFIVFVKLFMFLYLLEFCVYGLLMILFFLILMYRYILAGVVKNGFSLGDIFLFWVS